MKNSMTGALRCAKRILGTLVLGGLSVGGMVHAACNPSIPITRPDSRYEQVALATPQGSEVRDKVTGLVWQRCMVGMAWNGSTCVGTSLEFSWQNALEFARTATASTAATSAWRVPNRNELMSLLERACDSPAINTTWFPETPASAGLFSSSPFLFGFLTGAVWIAATDAGQSFGNDLNSPLNLRLVRFGP